MTRFTGAQAARLDDREYFAFALASIESAQRRILVSQFLFDLRPIADARGQVLELAMALAARRRLGLDVRVLVCGQVETVALGLANLAAGILLASHGVPVRRVFDVDAQRKGSHAKFVVCDDLAMVGSQNWTNDGFNDNIEDGVMLSGPPVQLLEAEFERLWAIAGGLPANETK
jgi:phosphatidylserine/phosphatidylglycerophosphate/cardiolipin synthase-like enzyme